MSLMDGHMRLIEKVNNSKTETEHRLAEATLRGYRDAIELAGFNLGGMLIAADMHYLNQGIERPMCCGVFLDWKALEVKPGTIRCRSCGGDGVAALDVPVRCDVCNGTGEEVKP